MDGWAARNDFYEKQKDVLKRIIRAWIPANDYLIAKPQEALAILHQKYYSNLSAEDIAEMHKAAKWYSAAEWAKYFRDGSATKWLNQVTNFNVEVGAIQNPIMAESTSTRASISRATPRRQRGWASSALASWAIRCRATF